MSQDFVVEKRITITQAKAVLEVGDSVIFKPENHNTLTVYRQGNIYKTFEYTQLGIDALVRTGTLAVPPPSEASPKSKPPVQAETKVPEEPIEKVVEGGKIKAEEPTPVPEIVEPVAGDPGSEGEAASATPEDADPDPALEVIGHYDTYTKKDLIAYATKNDIAIDSSKSRKDILALVVAAHPTPVVPEEATPESSTEATA